MCPAWMPNCHSLFEIWWESLEGKVLTYCLARLPVELAFDLGMITKIDFIPASLLDYLRPGSCLWFMAWVLNCYLKNGWRPNIF